MKDTATTEQPALRKDAARNRRRIMEAARALAHERKPVQLNAVAEVADVGVGTVYRHFPTPEALIAALAADQFNVLIRQAEQAVAAPDAQQALRDFLKIALTAYLRDDAFAAAVTDPNPATIDIQHLHHRLQDALRDLLARTAANNALHPAALTVADMMLLLCGIGFAIRHSANRDDPGLPDRYLSALLDGALTRHGG
ncbi:TetR/AcrR family transcriptional regulator [Rhodococcus wratislaviensis]|uniref:Putative TetR family transcriptional regulator n=1 Tax=Rhodococcus wratislaviensis NBRC 100605 TaxID=1219028 RepID=X0Q3A9_RHOWR|nr:TetR/AcrR family transcriptional regulator [Rhodococcus wratislaviensis]GAF45532.1 putative TetR family transcriptional regulator [Rhodococcus wratislaviensis NBRC 100605]